MAEDPHPRPLSRRERGAKLRSHRPSCFAAGVPPLPLGEGPGVRARRSPRSAHSREEFRRFASNAGEGARATFHPVEKPSSPVGCHGQADSPALWRICLSVSSSRMQKKDTDREDRAEKPPGLPCPWHPIIRLTTLIDGGISTHPPSQGMKKQRPRQDMARPRSLVLCPWSLEHGQRRRDVPPDVAEHPVGHQECDFLDLESVVQDQLERREVLPVHPDFRHHRIALRQNSQAE